MLVIATAVGVGAGVGLSRKSSNSGKSSVKDAESTAVSYYANLDWVFKRWPGNCFLKNGLGNGTSTGDGSEEWEHIASAYKNCLNGYSGCA